MTYSHELLIAAHKCCNRNRDTINKSTICGCFYCLKTFPAGGVQKYTPRGDALCPKCHINAVLADISGFPLTLSFLTAMYDYWLDTDVDPEV